MASGHLIRTDDHLTISGRYGKLSLGLPGLSSIYTQVHRYDVSQLTAYRHKVFKPATLGHLGSGYTEAVPLTVGGYRGYICSRPT